MLFTKLTIVALLASSVSVAATANPAPQSNAGGQGANSEVIAFCTDLIASGQYPALNFGECMGFNNTSENGFKTHVCDLFRETDSLADNGFSSYSDCVRNF